MSKLSGRLNRLRNLRHEGSYSNGDHNYSNSGIRSSKAQNAPVPWKGWSEIAPYVWKRSVETAYPAELQHVTGLLIKGTEVIPSLVFYDFETTGLSGGAGTLLFLAGFGHLEADSMIVDQILLADYPGEPAFIAELLKYLSREKVFVSYNGKGFDRHVLLNRLRLHGHHSADMPRQLDLLYPTRKIWGKSLERCNLGSIETHVLRIERELDIHGALIPECYQEFLRTQNDECMRKVVAHHVQDIKSLAQLLFHIEKVSREPYLLVDSDARLGLGRLLFDKGDPDGMKLLEKELEEGNEAAGYLLVTEYKRRRDVSALRTALEQMLAIRPGLYQVVEMAKLYEHIDRNPKAAIELIKPMFQKRAILSKPKMQELNYRYRRLERKLERAQ